MKSHILIKILITLSLLINKPTFCEKESNAGTIAAVTAGSAVAGFGIYQLFSTYCCSNDSLVEQACNELLSAKDFMEELDLFEETLQDCSILEKRQFLIKIDEEFAEDLISSSTLGLIDNQYYTNLKNIIKNLKFYETKLPKRIRKLEKQKNKTKFAEIVQEMKELCSKIEQLVPKLERLNQYINNHKKYFSLDELIVKEEDNYAQELKLMSSRKIFIRELKNCAYSKYSKSTYPLIDYIHDLDLQVSNLKSFISQANKYPNLQGQAIIIQNKLKKVINIISRNIDYLQEKKDKENSRILENSFLGFVAGTAIGLAATAKKPIDNQNYITQEEIIIIED